MTSSVAERQLGRFGKVVLVGLVLVGTFLASADLFSLVSFIVYMPVGAYLVMRRPRNPVGWLLVGIAFAFIGTTTSPSIDLTALARGEATLFDALNSWLAAWAGAAAFVGFLALTIIFPSGRLPQAAGRRTAIMLLLLGVAGVVLIAFAPTVGVSTDGGVTTVVVPNPVAVLPDLMIWSVLPVLQLRWLVAAVAFVVMGIVTGLLLTVLFGTYIGGAAWIPVAIAYPTIPLAVGIAVMRYHLYEIDRIVSRTIAYAVVTGVLAAVFGGAVLLLSTVLAQFAQGQTIAVAASTLAVFAMFQPVLRRVRRAVDRRFNRARYDAEVTVAAFAGRLRDELDLPTLTGELRQTTVDAVEPSQTAVWLRVARGTR
jgi:hypothetical protein